MGISVQELTKVYGTQKAIDNISFEISTGEIVGFLGPNGAGKTTTMKIITCFMPPTSGTVEMGKLNIFENSLEIRRKIGYLPEHNPLYLDMYVREYLNYTAKLYRMKGAERKQRVEEMISLTGLEREQHKKIRMLSKGYRQRVGLAQALIHDPEVLILDEPTSGLDPNQIIEIRNLIREISSTKTVMFSTHILQEVEAIADRVLILNQGKIIKDEQIENLKGTEAKEAWIYVGFEKPTFDFGKVKAVEGVSEVLETRNKEYIVKVADEDQLRVVYRTLQSASLEQENYMTSLRRPQQSLEDVFRDLTHKDKGGEA